MSAQDQPQVFSEVMEDTEKSCQWLKPLAKNTVCWRVACKGSGAHGERAVL